MMSLKIVSNLFYPVHHLICKDTVVIQKRQCLYQKNISNVFIVSLKIVSNLFYPVHQLKMKDTVVIQKRHCLYQYQNQTVEIIISVI